jgi:phosphatidylinositol 4-phosphatase
VLALNLVDPNKKMEKMLLDFYESLVKASALDWLNYKHFNFHIECAKNTDPLIALVDQIYSEYLQTIGLFVSSNHVILRKNQDGSTIQMEHSVID